MSAIQQAFWYPAASGGAFALPYTMDFTGGLAAYEALGFTFVLSDPVNNEVLSVATYSGSGGSGLYPIQPDTGVTPLYPDPPPTSGGNYLRFVAWVAGTLTINLPAALIAQNPMRVGFWGHAANTGGLGGTITAYDAIGNSSQLGLWPGSSGGPATDFVDRPRSDIASVDVVVKLVLYSAGDRINLDDITFYAAP